MNWLQQIATWLAKLKCWWVVRPWEAGIRVRLGRSPKLFGPGFHFRWPVVDETFAQNTRLRVLNLPVQTVTTKDGAVITLTATVEWQIENLLLCFARLHVPEDWIYNRVMSAIALEISTSSVADLIPTEVASAARGGCFGAEWFGMSIGTVQIVNFARVRTYRLIDGEGHGGWSWNRVGSLDDPQK